MYQAGLVALLPKLLLLKWVNIFQAQLLDTYRACQSTRRQPSSSMVECTYHKQQSTLLISCFNKETFGNHQVFFIQSS